MFRGGFRGIWSPIEQNSEFDETDDVRSTLNYKSTTNRELAIRPAFTAKDTKGNTHGCCASSRSRSISAQQQLETLTVRVRLL